MARKKYYKNKKRNYSKNYNRYSYKSNSKSSNYTIYYSSSTIFYILFLFITYQLGVNNPFFDSNPVVWWIGTYLFTELVGVFAYKSAYRIVGEHGIKGTGDLRAAIRSGEHWLTRLFIYAVILFSTSIFLWVIYGVSLLFS